MTLLFFVSDKKRTKVFNDDFRYNVLGFCLSKYIFFFVKTAFKG